MKKLSVCILFGGISPEHEVSLRSAESVLNNIDHSKYNVFPVGITKDGDWIWIENQFGKAKFKARFREGHMKDLVMVQHSWWLPEKGPETLYGVFDANVNLLIPNDVYSKTGYGGSHMKSVLCKVYPAESGIEGIYEGGEA